MASKFYFQNVSIYRRKVFLVFFHEIAHKMFCISFTDIRLPEDEQGRLKTSELKKFCVKIYF